MGSKTTAWCSKCKQSVFEPPVNEQEGEAFEDFKSKIFLKREWKFLLSVDWRKVNAETGKRIIIAGAPASGKGTQCEKIREEFGVVHISTGDLLREHKKNGTALGKQAAEFMDNGRLVPDQLVIDMVKDRMSQPDCAAKGWLLDGFPHTGAQAEAMKASGIHAEYFVLLDVPEEALVERVTGRRLAPQTGKIYHMKFKPPPNKKVAARLTQQSDDTEEKVKTRVASFHEQIDSILRHYTSILTRLDGNRKPDDVTADVRAILSKPPAPGKRIIIAGAPASGKGTQCEKIREEFGVVHISTGDLLREHKKNGTALGKQAAEFMDNGRLVPDQLVIDMVKD